MKKLYIEAGLRSTWEQFARGDNCVELKNVVLEFVSRAEPEYSDETDDNILEWHRNRAEELREIGVMSDAEDEEFKSWSVDVFRKHGFVACACEKFVVEQQ